MRPAHVHEQVGTKTEAKLFMNDVCLRAASELAGEYFLSYPLDSVQRTQQITVDNFEDDWTQVGFSATKMYRYERKYMTSVIYNFWVHSSMGDIPEMFKAMQDEQTEKVEDYLQTASIAIAPQSAGEDFDDDEDTEREIIEQIEYTIDSEIRIPNKEHCYVFLEDGETLGVLNFSLPYIQKWVGDTLDEQRLMQFLVEDYAATYDSRDIGIMMGILGRIGLLHA